MRKFIQGLALGIILTPITALVALHYLRAYVDIMGMDYYFHMPMTIKTLKDIKFEHIDDKME